MVAIESDGDAHEPPSQRLYLLSLPSVASTRHPLLRPSHSYLSQVLHLGHWFAGPSSAPSPPRRPSSESYDSCPVAMKLRPQRKLGALAVNRARQRRQRPKDVVTGLSLSPITRRRVTVASNGSTNASTHGDKDRNWPNKWTRRRTGLSALTTFLNSKSKTNSRSVASSPQSGLTMAKTQSLRVTQQPVPPTSPSPPSLAAPPLPELASHSPSSSTHSPTISHKHKVQHELKEEAERVITGIAIDMVETRLVQFRLGCCIVDSLDMVDRIVHLQLKKAQTLANCNSRGVKIDALTLAGAIHQVSEEKGLRDLPFQADDRYGKRYDMEQLINMASMYSSRPSFLDPIVATIWHSPAAEASESK
ncbi:hypothetical protein NMY22_g2567 [Coprinellus aureogranulatus]|nr:hypothetical protein NMY22_g2567 [Coprinellus aureogranulatus]